MIESPEMSARPADSEFLARVATAFARGDAMDYSEVEDRLLALARQLAKWERYGIVPCSIELLQELEGKESPPVTLRATRHGDGTWQLIVKRQYDSTP